MVSFAAAEDDPWRQVNDVKLGGGPDGPVPNQLRSPLPTTPNFTRMNSTRMMA